MKHHQSLLKNSIGRRHTENNMLILASASPARATLLEAAGIHFTQIPSGIIEPAWNPKHTTFEKHLLKLAEQKAASIAALHPDAFVIGADTAILLQNKMLGKGSTPREAKSILVKLAGKTHSITTAVCVIPPFKKVRTQKKYKGVETAFVTLLKLSKQEIDYYTANQNVLGCAGGYALQGAGSAIIRRIEGDPTTVIGMPINLTKNLLKKAQDNDDSYSISDL